MSDECKCGFDHWPLPCRERSFNDECRIASIKEVKRLCDEALDHDTPWPMFCNLIRSRLEIETKMLHG